MMSNLAKRVAVVATPLVSQDASDSEPDLDGQQLLAPGEDSEGDEDVTLPEDPEDPQIRSAVQLVRHQNQHASGLRNSWWVECNTHWKSYVRWDTKAFAHERPELAGAGVTRWAYSLHVIGYPPYRLGVEGAANGGHPTIDEAYEYCAKHKSQDQANLLMLMYKSTMFMDANSYTQPPPDKTPEEIAWWQNQIQELQLGWARQWYDDDFSFNDLIQLVANGETHKHVKTATCQN